MWAQQWGNVYDLVGVPGQRPRLRPDRAARSEEDRRQGHGAATASASSPRSASQPLPQTFWERSLFTKPQDRDVVCHASAWDVDKDQDLRIKMCIEITGEDFVTIHHELGHNFYQRAYRKQPFLYRNSANDGFHEAIGDAIALSVTPDYLVKVGLLDQAPGPDGDLEFLMRTALDKVAFLPFGLLVDQWRWKVFSGEVHAGRATTPRGGSCGASIRASASPSRAAATRLRPGRQVPRAGQHARTRATSSRTSCSSSSTARCAARPATPGRCTAARSTATRQVGAKLAKMLEMGQSRPWPDALEALTGERKMDATAILDYFAPLKEWLDAQAAAEKPARRRPPTP